MNSKTEDQVPKDRQSARFEFIKSNYFRVIHVDGAWGGVATSGGTPYVQMAVYNQRAPIPKAVQHSVRYVDAGFQIGDEQMDRREAREGLIREIEAQLIMDPHTTVNVTMWLLAKLSELSSLGVIEKDELRRLVNEVLGGEQP